LTAPGTPFFMVRVINTPTKNFIDAMMTSDMLRVRHKTQIDQTIIRRVLIDVMNDETVDIDSR